MYADDTSQDVRDKSEDVIGEKKPQESLQLGTEWVSDQDLISTLHLYNQDWTKWRKEKLLHPIVYFMGNSHLQTYDMQCMQFLLSTKMKKNI